MAYTVAIGSVVKSGSGKLVQVNLTMEDAGTVPSVALASMVIVSGINRSGQSTILKVYQPIANASYFFSNDKFSDNFTVLTGPEIDALHIELLVDVALTTKLMLDQPATTLEGLRNCPQGTQTEWYISESNLSRFTRGSQVLWSDSCSNTEDPYINTGISSVRGGRLVHIPAHQSVPIRDTSRSDMLVIG
jgi:hypothetical protein